MLNGIAFAMSIEAAATRCVYDSWRRHSICEAHDREREHGRTQRCRVGAEPAQ